MKSICSFFVRAWHVIEPIRFLWHGLSISACAYAAYALPTWFAIPFIVFAVFCQILFEWKIKYIPFIAKLLRREELERRTNAADFVYIVAILYVIIPQWLPIVLLATAWCDPCARAFGKTIGGPKIWFTEKSIAGSIACWLVAASILWMHVSWFPALIAGAAMMIAEAADPIGVNETYWLRDNGRLPLFGCLALVLLV